METRKKKKTEPSKNIFTQATQIVSKKKKKNYSIQHNFYDQKPCLNHKQITTKNLLQFFLKKNNSQSTRQTRAKKMAGQKLKTQDRYKEGQIKRRTTHISTQEATTTKQNSLITQKRNHLHQ